MSQIFLVLYISSNFGLYSEYFKYYVVRLWALLKIFYRNFYLFVCFSRQLTWLGSDHRSTSVCGGSSVNLVFKAFAIFFGGGGGCRGSCLPLA